MKATFLTVEGGMHMDTQRKQLLQLNVCLHHSQPQTPGDMGSRPLTAGTNKNKAHFHWLFGVGTLANTLHFHVTVVF